MLLKLLKSLFIYNNKLHTGELQLETLVTPSHRVRAQCEKSWQTGREQSKWAGKTGAATVAGSPLDQCSRVQISPELKPTGQPAAALELHKVALPAIRLFGISHLV